MEITLVEFSDIIINYPVKLKIISLTKNLLGSSTIYWDESLQDVVASIVIDKNGKTTYY